MNRLRAAMTKLRKVPVMDMIEAAGLLLVVAGVALVSVPAAVILAGVLLVGWANVRDLVHPRR